MAQQRRGTPSWKQGGGGSDGPKPTARHGWQQEPESPGVPVERWTRRGKQFLAAGGFIVASVTLILVILWLLPPKPAALFLCGQGYIDHLGVPHNAYGLNALKGLQTYTQESADRYWWGSGAMNLALAPKEPEANEILGLPLGKRREPTVVFYLALHGAADDKGAFLFVQKAGPEGQRLDRVYLKPFLEKLRDNDELRDNHKLLILDATQPAYAWSEGVVYNDFARELEKLDKEIRDVPNLAVFSASGPDQRSWVSEEWQKSIFAHYLLEGLRGVGRSESDRIKADELIQYVSRSVEKWSRENRGAMQTPVLLPKDDGPQRCAKMELGVIKTAYAEARAAEAPGASFKDATKIEEEWKKHQRLRQALPSPAVYAPHLWRRYSEMLLRYEELLRMGDAENTAVVKAELTKLEDAVGAARRLEVASGSLPTLLPMPAALGMSGRWVVGDDVGRKFEELWNAVEPAERLERWNASRKWAREHPSGEGSEALLRLRFAELLVGKVIGDEGKTDALQRACDLVGLVCADPPRPSEVHFLFMIREVLAHLQNIKPTDLKLVASLQPLVSKALEVRLLAEQAALATGGEPDHPYSERAFAWFRPAIESADENRRRGEDLLFASSDRWAEARRLLGEAEKEYTEIRTDALHLRKALATRDRMFVELPYYTLWLAQRYGAGERPGATNELLFFRQGVQAENLWKEVHRLALQLETPDRKFIRTRPPGDDTQLSIQERADKILADFGKVAEVFNARAANLARDAIIPQEWFEIQDLLIVPFLEPERRLALVRKSRRISHGLNEGSQQALSTPGKADEMVPREAATGHGRLALLVLGARSIKDKEKDALDATELTQMFNRALRGQWDEVLAAGSHLGRIWRSLPEDVNKLTSEARQLGNLTNAANSLERAERYARHLDGATAARAVAANPLEDARRLHAHHLLQWLARRTHRDFWAAEAEGATPHYRRVGDLLVNDSGRLLDALGGSEPTAQVKKERANDLEKARTELTERKIGPDQKGREKPLILTTEMQSSLPYRLLTEPGVPPGFPVLEVASDDKGAAQSRLLALTAPAEGERLVLNLKDDGAAPVLCQFTSPFLRAQSQRETGPSEVRSRQAALLFRGAYRGHRLDTVAKVELQALPDLALSQRPRPRLSGIAMRASPEVRNRYNADNAALVVVFDCSGSMAAQDDKGRRRIDAARDALAEVLATVEKGTRLSIWTFSDRTSYPGPNATGAPDEATIRQLVPPRPWKNPDEQAREVMAAVRRLEPGGATPLARAMVEARKDFDGIKGLKTLVVLTDGMDTCFEAGSYGDVNAGTANGDPKFNPGGTKYRRGAPGPKIRDFLLEQFGNEEIRVDIHMLSFQLSAKERELQREQFEKVIGELGGKYYPSIANADELVRRLKQAFRLRKLLFRLEDQAGNAPPGMPTDGFEISRAGGNPTWNKNLPPKPYTSIISPYRNDVLLERGGLLSTELLLDNRLRRVVYGKEDEFAGLPGKEQGDWYLALLENNLTMTGGAEWLVTLEDFRNVKPPSMQTALRQVAPGFVWLEVRPKGDSKPVPLRWGNDWGVPAPAFQLDVPEWQQRASPLIEVWWQQPGNPVPFSNTVLQRDPAKYRDLAEDFAEARKGIKVEGDEFVLESIGYERRFVEVAPKQRQEVDCLVIRGRHPESRTVLVHLEGLNEVGTGVEHQFFSRAGKYTGVYWPVTREQVSEVPYRLRLSSVEGLKQRAQQAGLYIRLDNLPAPGVNGNRIQRERLD